MKTKIQLADYVLENESSLHPEKSIKARLDVQMDVLLDIRELLLKISNIMKKDKKAKRKVKAKNHLKHFKEERVSISRKLSKVKV